MKARQNKKRPPAPTLANVTAALRAHESEIRDFGVVSLGVFGSVAKECADEESDVDLCVLEMDWDKFSAREGVMCAMLDLKKFFKKILGRKADVVYEPPDTAKGRRLIGTFKTVLKAPASAAPPRQA